MEREGRLQRPDASKRGNQEPGILRNNIRTLKRVQKRVGRFQKLTHFTRIYGLLVWGPGKKNETLSSSLPWTHMRKLLWTPNPHLSPCFHEKNASRFPPFWLVISSIRKDRAAGYIKPWWFLVIRHLGEMENGNTPWGVFLTLYTYVIGYLTKIWTVFLKNLKYRCRTVLQNLNSSPTFSVLHSQVCSQREVTRCGVKSGF